MDTTTFAAFRDELEKIALSPTLLKSYLAKRSLQGIGGAKKLQGSLPMGGTSRQIMGAMNPVQRGTMKGIAEGGQLHRKMLAEPSRVGLGQTQQAMQQRVRKAVTTNQEAARDATAAPLSKAYEGYMTASSQPYKAQHVEQMFGLKPGQGRLSKVRGSTPVTPATDATISTAPSTSDATVPSFSRRRVRQQAA